jgi:hypothetical protein
LRRKAAIVKSILEAERNSHLWFDKSNIYNKMTVTKFEDTWIVKFIRVLSRGVRKEDRASLFNKVSFVGGVRFAHWSEMRVQELNGT